MTASSFSTSPWTRQRLTTTPTHRLTGSVASSFQSRRASLRSPTQARSHGCFSSSTSQRWWPAPSPSHYCSFAGTFHRGSHSCSGPRHTVDRRRPRHHRAVAYALVIGTLLALDSQRWLTCGLLFGLAGITRETTLLFPLALIILAARGLGVKRRRPDELMLFGAIAFGPYIWVRITLYAWLGSDPPPGAPSFSWPPFSGLSGHAPQSQYEQLLAVVLPAFLALAAATLLLRGSRKWMILPLALNVLFLIVLLPESSYATFQSSGRISLGVVVAFAALCPELPVRHRTAAVVAPACCRSRPGTFLPDRSLLVS